MILRYFKCCALIALLFLFSFTSAFAGPLHNAAKRGDIIQIKRLLDSGSDVNAKDFWGDTPLHWAAKKGHKDIVELLLSKGADVNAKDQVSNTPLHWAVHKGHKDFVGLLLSKGADVNAKGYNSETPLHWAIKYGYKEIVELLKNYPKIKAELLLKKKRIQEQETLKSNRLINAEERKGDQAKKAGNHKKALSHYIAALKLTPPGTDMDLRLRKKTISFVRSMRPKPPFPAEAKRHAIRGQTFLKRAKDKEGYRRVLTEFQKAVQLAPWWASGYFNLALIQEKVDDFNGAIGNLKLYLIANPRARDAAAVEKKIIDLEVAGEFKGK